MKIDHICYAVKDTADALAYWKENFGYRQMTRTVINSAHKVKVTFICKEDSMTIKLIEPIEDNLSLAEYIRKEGAFHHVCFRCDDMANTISDLKSKGFIMLNPPAPGEAFNNKNIAFLLGRYGMNIELIDTDEKADML